MHRYMSNDTGLSKLVNLQVGPNTMTLRLGSIQISRDQKGGLSEEVVVRFDTGVRSDAGIEQQKQVVSHQVRQCLDLIQRLEKNKTWSDAQGIPRAL